MTDDWCPEVRRIRDTLDHEGVPYRYANVDLVEPSDDALRTHPAAAAR